MFMYRIRGGRSLAGELPVSGSKNSALPILAATLLTPEKCVIRNVPDLRDTRTMVRLLEHIGKTVDWTGNTVTVTETRPLTPSAPYDIVSTMRASICVLGPLTARFGRAEVSMPGGCAFGPRPIDLHLKAMQALGAEVRLDGGDIEITATKLRGAEMKLSGPFGPTVLGTDNAAMAATGAHGETIILDSACEPEVADLMKFLQAMGADISGIGEPILAVRGPTELHGAEHDLIPDRIEAGTFLALAAATRGQVKVTGVPMDHLGHWFEFMQECDISMEIRGDTIELWPSDFRSPGRDLVTAPYPGFATDLQPPAVALLAMADGLTVVRDNIYPSRFEYALELARMGAEVIPGPGFVQIVGVPKLTGADVMAADLRAGAALIIAAAAADGETLLRRSYHVERGYEHIIDKLQAVGVDIEKVPDPKGPIPAAPGD